MRFKKTSGFFPGLGLLLGASLCLLPGPLSLGQLLESPNASREIAPVPSPDSDAGWKVRRQVNEVTVMFTAKLKKQFVADLQPQDVQVRDDNKPPAAITDFRNEQNLPLRLGLLIDISGSVSQRIDFEKQAASQFIGEIVDQRHDQVFVAGFSHRMQVVQDLSKELAEVGKALALLHDDQADTALFDSITKACRKLAQSGDPEPVTRVLVVVSDGDDNASKHTLREVTEIAQSSEVTIYTISTNFNARTIYLMGDDVLEHIAKQSGGRALFPTSVKQVAEAFARIRDELRNRYAVSYRPADFKPDGHFRRIRIVVRHRDRKLRVQARKGYYARPAADADSLWVVP